MPYASNGIISQDPLEGGIEISEEEYSSSLNAILSGKEVHVINGELTIVDAVKAEADALIVRNQILDAPDDLFGGPTLEEVYNGN